VVKYLGAAYLVYLGIQTMLQKSRPESSALLEPQQLSRVFSQGVVVNVLNPKLALFFFAFLPQFIDPTRGTVTGQIVLLGSIFVLLGVLSDSLYALLAGTVGYYLHRNAALLRGQRYFAGSVYIALGVTTALSGSDHT
jgi:threonine/homoserine/homoserine lactone efflux protein